MHRSVPLLRLRCHARESYGRRAGSGAGINGAEARSGAEKKSAAFASSLAPEAWAREWAPKRGSSALRRSREGSRASREAAQGAGPSEAGKAAAPAPKK